ncbi:MAG: ATP-dependent RNA helicase DbpA [Halobacteriovoraceae bacterium]|nr:ATP-dependent RNA helicase DbpA [Halobacteriovoraceae bacterium]
MNDKKPFNQIPLKSELAASLKEMSFESMTPIQEMALPYILDSHDLIAQAKTGSGKTYAFGLGILNFIDESFFKNQALILCPTRELADQVASDLRNLGRKIENLKIGTLTGGGFEERQKKSLEHGVHIIVGTPGRVLKFLKKGILKPLTLKYFVLDEVDRMLDMGFKESIEEIVSYLPSKRQSLLFSATYPEKIQDLSKGVLKEPKFVKVDTVHNCGVIEERFVKIENHKEKEPLLISFLETLGPKTCLIFCKTKQICKDLSSLIVKKGFDALAIHGDLNQKERSLVLTKFTNGSSRLLVATDVAARGLDIEKLDVVINFDIPQDEDIYTHRIGRTGRANSKGEAVTFFIERERDSLEFLGNSTLTKPSELTMDKKEVIAPEMKTLLIAAGKKQKLRKADILGALIKDVGMNGRDIGKIDLLDHSSYVAIKAGAIDNVLMRLKSRMIKGKRRRFSKV